MNPIRWIRWRLLCALSLVAAILAACGLGSFARSRVNESGAAGIGLRWELSDLGLGAFGLRGTGLRVATADGRGRRTFTSAFDARSLAGETLHAPTAWFELDPMELARRRCVLESLVLERPRLELSVLDETPADGGWLATALRWQERIEDLRDRSCVLAAIASGEDGDPYSRRILYPFSSRPGFVLKRMTGEDLVIDIGRREPDGEPIARVERATLVATELTDRPDLHHAPITVALEGLLDGEPLRLGATIDVRNESSRPSRVELETGGLSASLVETLCGDALPVRLLRGRVALALDLRLGPGAALELGIELRFLDVELATKEGRSRVAGTDAARFVAAFNEASRALRGAPLEVDDLRIEGTTLDPRWIWGETIGRLARDGGLAFAELAPAAPARPVESEIE